MTIDEQLKDLHDKGIKPGAEVRLGHYGKTRWRVRSFYRLSLPDAKTLFVHLDSTTSGQTRTVPASEVTLP